MEAEKKKRKFLEEEEDEEAKIEEFFALIRRTREIRDRLRTNSNGSKKKVEDNKKTEEDKRKGIWSPTFRPEDFLVDYKSIVVGVSQAGPSNQQPEDDKKQGKGGNGIDLNLCL